MALSASRDTRQQGNGPIAARFSIPLKANAVVYAGGIVCTDSTGYGVPASTATGLVAIGRAASDVDNTGGANGAKRVEVEQGLFAYANSGVDPLAIADRGGLCYLVDDQTIAKTDGTGTRSCAGTFAEIDPITSEVWVQIGLTPNSTTALASLAALAVQLTGVQTIVGAKTFADGTLKQNNAAATFAHTFASAATAARVATLPDATDTLVGLAATQELSNKTLTAAVIKTGCTASGAAANDFSASTGEFKTSTGANTLSGDVTIAGAKTFTTGTGVVTFNGKQRAGAATNVIADPGHLGAIPVTDSGVCMITTAAAETGTLATPTFVGQVLDLICDVYAVGDRVITSSQRINQANNTTMTFGAAGDYIRLVGVKVGGALRWQVAANDGVTLG